MGERGSEWRGGGRRRQGGLGGGVVAGASEGAMEGGNWASLAVESLNGFSYGISYDNIVYGYTLRLMLRCLQHPIPLP